RPDPFLPPPSASRRYRRGDDAGRRPSPRREPVGEAAEGTMREGARGGRPCEAERGVQRELAAVEPEEPHGDGIGRHPGLAIAGKTAHDQVEIESVRGHAAAPDYIRAGADRSRWRGGPSRQSGES